MENLGSRLKNLESGSVIRKNIPDSQHWIAQYFSTKGKKLPAWYLAKNMKKGKEKERNRGGKPLLGSPIGIMLAGE
jgi:hypothetical protein